MLQDEAESQRGFELVHAVVCAGPGEVFELDAELRARAQPRLYRLGFGDAAIQRIAGQIRVGFYSCGKGLLQRQGAGRVRRCGLGHAAEQAGAGRDGKAEWANKK